MGKKTSVYLTDDLAERVAESPERLADLIYRGLEVSPLLVERNEPGGFVTHWYCEVPPERTGFKVLVDRWRNGSAGLPVREIYQIEFTGDQSSDE